MKQLEFPFMEEIREQEYISKINRRIRILALVSVCLFILWLIAIAVAVYELNQSAKELQHVETQTTYITR